MKTIILDDDADYSNALGVLLNKHGLNCQTFSDTESLFKNHSNDILIYIIDFHLANKEKGSQVSKKLRDLGYKNIIIMLTADDKEDSAVESFSNHVDDFLQKPLRIKELLARINRHVTNLGLIRESELNFKNIKIDILSKKITLNNKEIFLTPSEFKIVYFLIKNKGQVKSREKIINYINDCKIIVSRRTIDTHINSIRRKIPKEELNILSKRGFGYILTID